MNGVYTVVFALVANTTKSISWSCHVASDEIISASMSILRLRKMPTSHQGWGGSGNVLHKMDSSLRMWFVYRQTRLKLTHAVWSCWFGGCLYNGEMKLSLISLYPCVGVGGCGFTQSGARYLLALNYYYANQRHHGHTGCNWSRSGLKVDTRWIFDQPVKTMYTKLMAVGTEEQN